MSKTVTAAYDSFYATVNARKKMTNDEWFAWLPAAFDQEKSDETWLDAVVLVTANGYKVQTEDDFGFHFSAGLHQPAYRNIFVRPAPIFTMTATILHELMHIVINNDYIERRTVISPKGSDTEIVCESVAALALLVRGITDDIQGMAWYLWTQEWFSARNTLAAYRANIESYTEWLLADLDKAAKLRAVEPERTRAALLIGS